MIKKQAAREESIEREIEQIRKQSKFGLDDAECEEREISERTIKLPGAKSKLEFCHNLFVVDQDRIRRDLDLDHRDLQRLKGQLPPPEIQDGSGMGKTGDIGAGGVAGGMYGAKPESMSGAKAAVTESSESPSPSDTPKPRSPPKPKSRDLQKEMKIIRRRIEEKKQLTNNSALRIAREDVNRDLENIEELRKDVRELGRDRSLVDHERKLYDLLYQHYSKQTAGEPNACRDFKL